jgi:hypothetical protein
MKWFHYSQNNSGGSFDIDPARGIGPHVWVEAPSIAAANAIAQSKGVYFNGCETGQDCPCCGDRWSEPWDDDGKDVPLIYPQYAFGWHDAVYFHRLDGTLVTLKKDGTVSPNGATLLISKEGST